MMPTSAPNNSSDRRRVWTDHGIGVALFVGSLLAVLSTNDMGFVRDEAFYFRHAETYQDWFVDVAEGGETRAAAVRRERILATWHNNAEHPPLDKILFGWSWRLFGRKLRPVGGFVVEKGSLKARISGLGAAHGFQKGARIRLLRPQVVGEDATPDHRVLAAGEVVERSTWGASVAFDAGASLKALRAVCKPPGPDRPPTVRGGLPGGVIRRTGCEALEERATYVLSESSAMRAPGALFAALLVWLLWLTARGFFWSSRQPLMGRPFAVVASVGYLLLPRAFYHAHLACFDTTIVTLLFATTVAYHASLRRRRWLLPAAVLWGFALLAKHNAFVLPAALMVHWLWDGLAEGRLTVRSSAAWVLTRRSAAGLLVTVALVTAAAALSKLLAIAVLLAAVAVVLRVQLPPIPTAWFVMLPVGFAILIAGWPLLWVDTLDNLLKWIEFHLHHEHYMQMYRGQVLAYPPFPVALPWVLTALTWPLTLLLPAVVAMLLGFAGELRRLLTKRGGVGPGAAKSAVAAPAAAERRSFERLTLMSTIWPILLIAMPSTPVFGGTKHWFLAYPFMLLLAGRLLDGMWRLTLARGVSRARATAAAWALALLVLAPAAKATWDVHPHGTLYYNELIGGVPGAAKAGMQRQFWGGATRAGLAEINRRAKKHARVWFHNSAWGAFRMYQREGWLRRDLSYANEPESATLGFFHHQRAHDDYELQCMRAFNTASPIAEVHLEGVPILSVYQHR